MHVSATSLGAGLPVSHKLDHLLLLIAPILNV
jgi:hypothetical protein